MVFCGFECILRASRFDLWSGADTMRLAAHLRLRPCTFELIKREIPGHVLAITRHSGEDYTAEHLRVVGSVVTAS